MRCNGSTTTAAVLGELGWWKLKTRREYIKLRYWINILLMDESRLVKAVYNHSKHLFITRKKNNLAKIIYQLTNKYNLQELSEGRDHMGRQ